MTILSGRRDDFVVGAGPSGYDVPAADPAAVIDPNWLRLRGGSTLPTIYLPPAMQGRRSLWLRVVAVALVALFLAATFAGVCLTYGPPLGRI